MSAFCCGKMRKAKFCPECGTDLRNRQPLISLLHHCQMSMKKAIQNHRPGRTESAARWRGWVDAIRAILDEQGIQYSEVSEDDPVEEEELE